MTRDEVPEGTIPDVLAWVDNDPNRAQDALDAELSGSARTTLINQLEPIAAQEAAVSDPEATTDDVEETEVEEAPAPEPPALEDVILDPHDGAVVVGPLNARSDDVEIPEDNYAAIEAADPDDTPEPLAATAVDFFQLMSSNGVVELRINDTAHRFDAQQALALSRDLRAALANVTY